jgi:hypothetical protein
MQNSNRQVHFAKLRESSQGNELVELALSDNFVRFEKTKSDEISPLFENRQVHSKITNHIH